jgi:hypothetical protein
MAPTDTPLDIFPDGLKTTGQHPPLYDQLQPFARFPSHISGPTVWKADDYTSSPEKWTYVFTDDDIAELSAAADAFIAAGGPLTGITRVPSQAPFSPRTHCHCHVYILMGNGDRNPSPSQP